jgi:ArsR family transcriptional regulator, nickel/cobalt-responsive transcriptional repressor
LISEFIRSPVQIFCSTDMPHPLEHSPPDRPLGAEEASQMAEAMSVFATESRVRLLYALLDEPRGVDELADAVEMDPSAVSQQLRVLRQLRFVVAEREGRRMRYRLHDDHVAELLAAVRHHHEHASHGWMGSAGAPGAGPRSRARRVSSARRT